MTNNDKVLDPLEKYLEEFDINSIPLDVRKKQYKDYRSIFDFVNRECREWNLDENLNYIGSEISEIQKIT